MKQKLFSTFLATVVIAVSSFSASARDIFPSLFNSPDIESAYVSKSMIYNSDKSRDIVWHKLNLYNSQQIDDLYVYSSQTEAGLTQMADAFEEFKKQNKDLEILMRTKSNKELSLICGLPIADKPGYYSDLIIISEGKAMSIVTLSGVISLSPGN